MAWTCDISIEEKVRQDCYNRGYEQGRKNPCDEIVAHIEELQNQVKEYKDKIEQRTLKEEKTCQNISEMHPVDEFTCSKCGITLVDYVRQIVDEDYETTYHEYEIKYCPNCGAKVVQNG